MNTSQRKKIVILTAFLIIVLFLFNCCVYTRNEVILTKERNREVISTFVKRELSTKSIASLPYIGEPHLNATTFGSTEDALVTVPATDSDGIKNISLFWQYQSINTTIFNRSMTAVHFPFLDQVVSPETNWLDENGSISDIETNWKYANFTYETTINELITEISTTIVGSGSQNDLVYALIKEKNVTSGEWGIILEEGVINGTIDLGSVSYTDTNSTLGYQIFAVAYSGTKTVQTPQISLTLYRDEYNGVIDASNQPTFVNYFITAFDNLNNSMTTNNYTFLMNWEPIVTINDLPTTINPDHDFILNVTVTEQDGISTIDDTSVITYYRLEGDEMWNSFQLTHIVDLSSTAAFYNGTIPITGFEDQETTIDIIVNASDTINGERSLEGTSGIHTFILDNLGPRITSITVTGEISVPNLENVTSIFAEVNISASFTDPSGIKSVYIYYSMPNGTIPIKLEMTNITLSDFLVTLPPANNDSIVSYFFESVDNFDNKVNTTINYYYADGIGPSFETIDSYPLFVSNYTNGIILFNASDNSGIQTPIIYYTFDSGTDIWSNTTATLIDYASMIDYHEKFSISDLPRFIQNNDTIILPLEVNRNNNIDSAILTLEFTHDQGTDLRIWLILDDGRSFLIFDRESEQNTIVRSIDLFALGLTQSDFDNSNFTLKIQDFSDLFSGAITKFEIQLIHYSVPLGYQYLATIPPTGIDTTVYYYITLADPLLNVQNSSLYSYTSDGLPPSINVQNFSSPVDMEGKNLLEIKASVNDTGGLLAVELYYKYAATENWLIEPMNLDLDRKLYVLDIVLPFKEGILYFYIRAYDMTGLSAKTDIMTIEYENTEIEQTTTPTTTPTTQMETKTNSSEDPGIMPFIGIIAIVGLGSLGILGYLIQSKKLKIFKKEPSD